MVPATVAVQIPDELDANHPEEWKRADVLSFLEANQARYELENDSVSVFRENRVAGRRFLQLTLRDLRKRPYSLPDGAAATIHDFITTLKHSQGTLLHLDFIISHK